MPEPAPAFSAELLRRHLSPFERNVLAFGARGGAALVYREMNLASEEHAERVLAQVKSKVERLAAGERDVPEVTGERPRRKRRAPSTPRAAPVRDALADRLLALVEECGPTRQADARDALGVSGPMLSTVVASLVRSGRLVQGERVQMSPLLTTPAQANTIEDETEVQVDGQRSGVADETGPRAEDAQDAAGLAAGEGLAAGAEDAGSVPAGDDDGAPPAPGDAQRAADDEGVSEQRKRAAQARDVGRAARARGRYVERALLRVPRSPLHARGDEAD